MERKSVVVREVPVDVWRELKAKAALDDETIAAAITKAITLYLKSA